MTKALLTPIQLAGKTLKNRIVLPPMTRSRANNPEQAATPLMAQYYSQRTGAGLMISEGTQVSPLGKGYAWTPGIYSAAQIHGWQQVTEQVHKDDAVFFAQLWHVGRVTHPDNIGGEQPISSSAIAAKEVKVFVDNGTNEPGFVDVVTPREMTHDDIKQVKAEFKQAALNAVKAGFDGIELHAANGYLINQFIDSQANNRTDEYGGSLANRLRFLDEVITVMSEVIGSEKVGVRLAPLTTLNGAVDDNPQETYTAAAALLNKHNVAYIHIAEADWDDAPVMSTAFKQALRDNFDGVIIYAGKYTVGRAEKALADGLADMIAFGRPFVANPDLPERIKNDIPWATHDATSLFGGGAKGLIDYPQAKAQAKTQAKVSTATTSPALFQPTQLGQATLTNRIVMAPMTRSRTSQPGDVPNDIMARYYAQRATAGLIITEGSPISAVARG